MLQLDPPQEQVVDQGPHVGQAGAPPQAGQVALIGRGEGLGPASVGVQRVAIHAVGRKAGRDALAQLSQDTQTTEVDIGPEE